MARKPKSGKPRRRTATSKRKVVATPSPNGKAEHEKSSPPLQLSPQHLEELRGGSGLSDDTIRAAGCYSVEDGGEVSRLLNWKGGGGNLGACLAFPFFGPDGKPLNYVRLKPSCPR